MVHTIRIRILHFNLMLTVTAYPLCWSTELKQKKKKNWLNQSESTFQPLFIQFSLVALIIANAWGGLYPIPVDINHNIPVIPIKIQKNCKAKKTWHFSKIDFQYIFINFMDSVQYLCVLYILSLLTQCLNKLEWLKPILTYSCLIILFPSLCLDMLLLCLLHFLHQFAHFYWRNHAEHIT